MKNRRFVPSSAGEGDYLPSGEFAISVTGQGIQTHLGMVPLPPHEPDSVRYPVITNVGGFRIAGQRQSSVAPVVIWDGQWRDGAALPDGTQPCLYDNAGTLLVNNGSAGAQGYQYCAPDGRIYTGDECQGPLSGVNNWIDLSVKQDRSLLVGYANWTFAVIVWDGTHHRLIEAGNAKTLRAHRQGDAISLTWRADGGAPLILTDEAELRSLPIFEPSAPPPHVPDPVPVPPKPPEPVPMADVPNYESLVKSLPLPLVELGVLNDRAEAIRAAKGEDAPETQAAEAAVNQVKGACCQTIVAALNAHEGGSAWGLLKKDSGQHWTRSDGVNLSTDIAFDRREMRLVDVMSDRAPSWDVHAADDQQPIEKFVAQNSVTAPLPSNPPPLDPGPPSAPDPGLAALQAEIDAIKTRLAQLEIRPTSFPDVIALQASNGQFVSAEGGGGGTVVANRPKAGAWETFRVFEIVES